MNLIIYEEDWHNFYPLTNLIPLSHLFIGIRTIGENNGRILKTKTVDYIYNRKFLKQKANPDSPTIYLSAQFLITKNFRLPKMDCRLLAGDRTVGLIKYHPPLPENLNEIFQAVKNVDKAIEIPGLILNHPWDFIRYNESILLLHLKNIRKKTKIPPRAEIIGKPTDLYIAPGVRIHPYASFDLSRGPIFIDRDAEIGPFTSITGPCYIGQKTKIEHANIQKSTIGPVCRISGEVESCIFGGFSNKHHQGFIGHSYIGQWVNLGALTTNSDLKNNYSEVRVLIGEKIFNTGMVKLGCFIGDHTKLGIGTLLPTGGILGSFVNYFGGGTTPKFIPCFKWVNQRSIKDYELEKAVQTAKKVMARRNIKMKKSYENLIRNYYKWQTSLSQ